MLMAAFAVFLSWQGAAAATLSVTTEADEGGAGVLPTNACSLREAITVLNNAGAGAIAAGCPNGSGDGFGTNDLIVFNIGTMANPPVARIRPNPRLPNLNVPMTIDGYTQAGAQPNTNSADAANPNQRGINASIRIEIDGSAQPNGPVFRVRGGSTTITGLAIFGGPADAIRLEDLDTNLIVGNYIGLDASGTGGAGNVSDGVVVEDPSTGNRIGGTQPRERNLISNNGQLGVRIKSDDNTIQGNLIGTSRSGLAARPNLRQGILVSVGFRTLIGSLNTAGRNFISGNRLDGILVKDCPCAVDDTTIANNFIGVDVTGNTALANGQSGIQVRFGPPGTTIGPGNVISGNRIDGILLDFPGDDTVIVGNLIGVGANGTTPIGNRRDGIFSNGGIGVTTGGAPADGNVIAHNGGNGVSACACASENRIQGNSIFANGELGIDLDLDGVTPNDVGDGDVGANLLQNFPELTTTIAADLTTDVAGTLNSLPLTDFEIDLYVSASCDPSGFGEGQQFLRRVNVTTDASGDAAFSIDGLPPTDGLPVLTATATDPDGNTSEFSACAAFGSRSKVAQGVDDLNLDDANVDDRDKDDDGKKKETEEQRQQRERTNRSNKSDYATEGNVLGVETTPDGKHSLVTIGVTRSEMLVVRVTCIDLKCPDIRPGDYLEADGYQNGVGDPNTYFIAEDVTIRRNGKKVK